jgi:hypothetical protein
MSNSGINPIAATPDIETDRMRLNLLVLKDNDNSPSEEPTMRALIQGLRAYPYEEILMMTQKHPITKSSYSDLKDDEIDTSKSLKSFAQ